MDFIAISSFDHSKYPSNKYYNAHCTNEETEAQKLKLLTLVLGAVYFGAGLPDHVDLTQGLGEVE